MLVLRSGADHEKLLVGVGYWEEAVTLGWWRTGKDDAKCHRNTGQLEPADDRGEKRKGDLHSASTEDANDVRTQALVLYHDFFILSTFRKKDFGLTN